MDVIGAVKRGRSIDRQLVLDSLRICLTIVCLVAIAFAVRALVKPLHAFAYGRAAKGQDLSEAYVKPGLNVDSLPVVKVDYGKFKPEQNVPGDDDAAEDDDEEEEKENVADRRYKCLTKGYYLGANNNYVDCATFCGVSSEEEVQYRFVEEDGNRILTGQNTIKPGAWCLPTTAANCNPRTSILVYSLNGWFCLSQTDAFAGEGGNRIVVCDGRLRDNGVGKTYETFIPSNLAFNDVYRDKLSNGKYRFECPDDTLDEYKNKYIVSRYNRLHNLRNYCLLDLPFGVSADAVLNQDTATCECSGQYGRDDEHGGKCTSCTPRFDPILYTSHLYNRPCFSIRDYPETLERFAADNDTGNKILLPCGYSESSGGISREPVNPRCIFTNVPVYSPMLVSNNTLKYIDGL